MKKKWFYGILPVITLILEILPFGAVCNFANPDGAPWRQTFSYFDLLPFGYANFSPFLTAIMTCLVLAAVVAYCYFGTYGLAKIAKEVLFVAVLLSLGPLLLGAQYYSVVGAMITFTLLAEFLLLQITVQKPKE